MTRFEFAEHAQSVSGNRVLDTKREEAFMRHTATRYVLHDVGAGASQCPFTVSAELCLQV